MTYEDARALIRYWFAEEKRQLKADPHILEKNPQLATLLTNVAVGFAMADRDELVEWVEANMPADNWPAKEDLEAMGHYREFKQD